MIDRIEMLSWSAHGGVEWEASMPGTCGRSPVHVESGRSDVLALAAVGHVAGHLDRA